jgi:hypothetical protein
MINNSNFFMVGKKTIEFHDKDPIFFRSKAVEEQKAEG